MSPKDSSGCCRGLRAMVERFQEADIEMGIVQFLGRLLSSRVPEVDAAKLWSRLRESDLDAIVADLRVARRYDAGHVPGAEAIHFDVLYRRLVIEDELQGNRDKEIYVPCDTGHMSQVAVSLLVEEKFTRIFNLRGGMEAWPFDLEKVENGQVVRIEGTGERPTTCCASSCGRQLLAWRNGWGSLWLWAIKTGGGYSSSPD